MPQPSWSPSTTQQLRKFVAAPYLPPNDWTPRSDAYFVFPLAQGTPGKQCGLAATGGYQPSLRSPCLAAPVLFSIKSTLHPSLGFSKEWGLHRCMGTGFYDTLPLGEGFGERASLGNKAFMAIFSPHH
ncbi:hypothetical protein [Thiolapillus sp.]|uniref:hypothetical protein n=1 Tax=Thiolapillus sp. TaxID=2017437 RepID=UPI003AF65359